LDCEPQGIFQTEKKFTIPTEITIYQNKTKGIALPLTNRNDEYCKILAKFCKNYFQREGIHIAPLVPLRRIFAIENHSRCGKES